MVLVETKKNGQFSYQYAEKAEVRDGWLMVQDIASCTWHPLSDFSFVKISEGLEPDITDAAHEEKESPTILSDEELAERRVKEFHLLEDKKIEEMEIAGLYSSDKYGWYAVRSIVKQLMQEPGTLTYPELCLKLAELQVAINKVADNCTERCIAMQKGESPENLDCKKTNGQE